MFLKFIDNFFLSLIEDFTEKKKSKINYLYDTGRKCNKTREKLFIFWSIFTFLVEMM